MNQTNWKVVTGDCLEVMSTLDDRSVHCCVTSPPYFGLRTYHHSGQIGLEETPQVYIDRLVSVFSEVHRVLRDDGTLWLNLGDSYSKDKQLMGIPWRVAFALQDSGWRLRQDIIWHKPNPTPESVQDRCTKAHEYMFFFVKSRKYHYDADAVREQATYKPTGTHAFGGTKYGGNPDRRHRTKSGKAYKHDGTRNRRSVWVVSPKPYKGAHLATYPPGLVKPCILAGCPVDGLVMDPFVGSGTTGEVAVQNRRRFLGIDINPEYSELARERIANAIPPMFRTPKNTMP